MGVGSGGSRGKVRHRGVGTTSGIGVVEFKGVRWSSKASRAGIETEGWAERDAGKSP